MEDGLRVIQRHTKYSVKKCLNPCFSGGWSQSILVPNRFDFNVMVLILVLVEDGLREPEPINTGYMWKGLNPCFSGGWSQSTPKLMAKRETHWS